MRRRGLALGASVGLLLGVLLTLYRVHGRTLPTLLPGTEQHVVGAFHMHSADSHDSNLSLDVLAGAARAQNLDFLVVTDHNKQRVRATEIENVTLLSFAELSTSMGHCVQLGATYTLDPTLRQGPSVHAAVRAAGGVSILTHPSDIKRPWRGSLDGAGGLEVANLSASARRAARPLFFGLLPELIAWPWNPSLSLAQLYDRDEQALAMWDSHPDPQFVGLCGSDTHGWIDPALNLQAWFVVMDTPMPREDRPRALVTALRAGRFHCVAGLLGHDPAFAFSARLRRAVAAVPGDTISRDAVDALAVTAPSGSGGPSVIILLRDGVEVTRSVGNTLLAADPTPGSYRVEVHVAVPDLVFGDRWVPAIYSNRIRVTQASGTPPTPGVR